jgi:intracellular septation protein
MNKNISKNFFLISFLPAIAYWYLEENYSLQIAIIGGLGLAVLEIVLEKIFTKHVHSLSKFNLILLLLLGGLSLLGDEGIWFKLQPFFTGLGICFFLIYKLIRGNGMLYEMIENLNNFKELPPKEIIISLEKHLTVFFLIYSIWMGYLAVYMDTKYWIFFKTIGLYICFGVFFIIEFFLMRSRARAFYLAQSKVS